MANNWSGDIRSNMIYQNQLGMNYGDINAARKLGANGIDDLGPVTEETKKIMEDMKESDVDQYIKENTAMSDITKAANGMETWLQKTFGNSDWLNFESLGTAAFTAYLASSALNVGKSILSGGAKLINWLTGGKMASALATAFGGKFSGIANKLFGSTSTIGKSAANLTASGAGGKGLGMLGTAGVVVGLTAATIGALGSYFTGKREEAYNNQYEENLESLKGTANEGNASVASADTIASSTNSMTGLGTAFSNTTNGIGHGFSALFTKDKDSQNKSLTKWMYQGGVFENRDSAMAWALLMDLVGSLNSLKDLGFTFSTDEIKKYIKNMDNEGKIDVVWGTVNNILKAGWHPYKDNNDGKLKTYDEFTNLWNSNNNYGPDEAWEGYHKAGLDRVPKDNYKALLHKDEMVLNEREAKQYRTFKENEKEGKLTNQDVLNYDNIMKIGYRTQDPAKNVGLGGPGILFKGHWIGYGGGVDMNYKPYPITAGYPTYPSGKIHRGVDFGYPSGTPIGSANSGEVVGINADGSAYGNHVKVKGDNGLYFLYAHMTSTAVNKGDRVNAGQLLGYSGSTGNSTGPHLHYEVRNGTGNYKQDIDPYPYITSSLWSIGDTSGTPSAPGNSTSEDSNSSESSENKHLTLAAPTTTSRRAIPGLGGPDLDKAREINANNGIDRIVNSVDGVSTKIIKYLDEIRQEQEAQRSLIRAFSTSQNMIDMRN